MYFEVKLILSVLRADVPQLLDLVKLVWYLLEHLEGDRVLGDLRVG